MYAELRPPNTFYVLMGPDCANEDPPTLTPRVPAPVEVGSESAPVCFAKIKVDSEGKSGLKICKAATPLPSSAHAAPNPSPNTNPNPDAAEDNPEVTPTTDPPAPNPNPARSPGAEILRLRFPGEEVRHAYTCTIYICINPPPPMHALFLPSPRLFTL